MRLQRAWSVWYATSCGQHQGMVLCREQPACLSEAFEVAHGASVSHGNQLHYVAEGVVAAVFQHQLHSSCTPALNPPCCLRCTAAPTWQPHPAVRMAVSIHTHVLPHAMHSSQAQQLYRHDTMGLAEGVPCS